MLTKNIEEDQKKAELVKYEEQKKAVLAKYEE